MNDLHEKSHDELVDIIVDYYDKHFKWQKLVYEQDIDRGLVSKMSDEQLIQFIQDNCK